MAYEQKPNTGSLFKNDRATTEKHPQATGSAIIEGVEYFVDAWTNIDKAGNRYQSLKFKRKDKQAAAPAPSRQESYGSAKGGSAARMASQDFGSYGRQPDDLDQDTIPF